MLSRFTRKPVAAALLVPAVDSGPVLAEDTIMEETTVLPDRSITPADEAQLGALIRQL